MFLHPSGRQILLLQSYRDSRGKVRQRRLAGFSQPAQLDQHWQRLHQQFPHQRQRLQQLRERAVEMLAELPPSPAPRPRDHQSEIRRHARALLRLLAQGSLSSPELVALRARLEAGERTSSLEDLAENKLEQGELHDCAEILSLDPPNDRDSATRRAELWAELDLAEEGVRLLEQLPLADGWAHINRAALLLRTERLPETLESLSKGLALDPNVLPDLEQLRKGRAPQGYWHHYQHLWDETGRDFLMRLWKQTLVKIRTHQARQGRRFHRLVKARSQGWLLERTWERQRAH